MIDEFELVSAIWTIPLGLRHAESGEPAMVTNVDEHWEEIDCATAKPAPARRKTDFESMVVE